MNKEIIERPITEDPEKAAAIKKARETTETLLKTACFAIGAKEAWRCYMEMRLTEARGNLKAAEIRLREAEGELREGNSQLTRIRTVAREKFLQRRAEAAEEILAAFGLIVCYRVESHLQESLKSGGEISDASFGLIPPDSRGAQIYMEGRNVGDAEGIIVVCDDCAERIPIGDYYYGGADGFSFKRPKIIYSLLHTEHGLLYTSNEQWGERNVTGSPVLKPAYPEELYIYLGLPKLPKNLSGK